MYADLYWHVKLQDLQVKSPPPVQIDEQINNDPAIIQVLTFENI